LAARLIVRSRFPSGGLGSFDAILAVSIDRRMRAENQAADIGQDCGAAGGDTVLGEEQI
jgi:hypothetical protein